MKKKKEENAPVEGMIDGTDFVELKRDMQSAKVMAWLEYNQQQLIAGVIVLLLALVGVSVWKEQQLTEKNSAALVYMKAINTADETQRASLLDTVTSEYAGTGYAILAKLQKIKISDAPEKQVLLRSLIESKVAPEFVWQARLDLAELLITEGKSAEAEEVLAERLGKEYEQARYALLASLTEDKVEKVTLIQKALDAVSNDNDLVTRLEAELASLRLEK
ncbi:MAG: tetratricopeptide repeat protein [Ghiorsea sp.]|nr:tetratricopeptide repeat protein [Ghiorsea sp.]MDQ7058134.1 tetratricopeptide repeat protein [Ghiorsea sp.]